VRVESLFRILFVVYCVEAGLLLVVAPWTPTWSRLSDLLPLGLARQLLLAPALRGLVSGFGLVHLVWAFHDLDLLVHPDPQRTRGGGSPPGP
jgi:hypothetical protein